MKASRMRIVLTLTLVAGAVGACKRDDFSINLRPCNAQGRCATPYQCRSPDNVCVRVLTPNCAGGGLCPSSVKAGESCASVEKGALLPCRDDAEDCRYGCRACIEGTWSDCSYCALGSDYTCSSCSDDCTAYQQGAYVYCDTKASPQCNYSECKENWYDADGDRTNGCECTPTGETCNGKDDDCNGIIDDENTPGCTTHYLDADGDGHGTNASTKCLCGPGGGYVAAADDCDDTVASCTTDCVSDVDGDGVIDCIDTCVDRDGDGYGDGRQGNAGCAHSETDCDDGAAACTDNCGPDLDLDGVNDCKDPCVDKDGDGVGAGPLGNTGCPHPDVDDDDDHVCADTDGDTCDDCSSGTYDPSNDGVDQDGDGSCDAGDCMPTLAACDVATCQVNSNTAAEQGLSLPAGVVVSAPDCLETYCGTDPAQASVGAEKTVCYQASSQAELNAALGFLTSDGTGRGGRDHILIKRSFTATSGFTAIPSTKGNIKILAAPGAEITVNASSPITRLFYVQGRENVLEGLRIKKQSGVVNTVVSIANSDNVVRNCTIDGFDQVGIRVTGSNHWVIGNTVRGGTDTDAAGKAAIFLPFAQNTRVVGNVLTSNNVDGIELSGATGTFLDHNTIAGNANDGIEFTSFDSTDTCLRNNIIANNSGAAVSFSAESTWNTSSSCKDGSLLDRAYKNAHFGNRYVCSRTTTNDCCSSGATCYYGDNAWGFTSDPRFVSIDPASTQYYCLRVSSPTSPLLNQGSDLGYDRLTNATTTSPGAYNGSAPEVGARETGVGGCPAP